LTDSALLPIHILPAGETSIMDMIQEGSHVAHDEAVRASQLASSGEYLTFRLGAEEYGIDILKVQEIRSYESPTRIANAPNCIKGVVNLRGVIVPIADLRLHLGCDSAEYNDFTVVIVLNVRGRVVGAVVDSVSDVLALSADMIRPAPYMASAQEITAITGIASVQERMLILMDIEALMSSPAMALIDGAAPH
jgi:purine-binding chemotaxis protein CheW